jgi:rare lipoprotein A
MQVASADQGRAFALLAKLAGVSLIALGLANCANQQQSSRPLTDQQRREIGAFSDPRYGRASPRVVGLDESAPKGGGRQQVGRPYMIAGRRYVPREKPDGFTQTGGASWYGVAFHGRKTANGEVYDRHSISAAHPTMPLPSYARVTNLTNNHSIIVRVNDRGPYHGGRIIDLSEKTATLLNFKHMGTARVKVDYLGPASTRGSDDTRLIASLRTNGPAQSPGLTAPTMVASAEPIATARPQQPLAFTARTETPLSRVPQQAPGVITETRFTPVSNIPLPPERPFDLETIGNAARPVTPGSLPVSQNTRSPAPRSASLSFVEHSGIWSTFGSSMALAPADVLLPPQGK